MDKDIYEILGIKKEATEKEIQQAFRRLAKKYHPDVNPNNKEAEQKFKEVNLAYEVLKDPQKRQQYDQMRAMGANPFARGQRTHAHAGGPAGFGADSFADFGLGDLFEEIFGNAGGVGGGGRRYTRSSRGFAQRGPDREASLTISFLEAARGAEKMVDLPGGKRLTIRIPEGVESGSRIKLSGQGEPGIGGAPSGDLIVELKVQPSDLFTRDGNNLVVKVAITFAEAVLGAEVDVPTLDGKAVVKVPKGVSSGQSLKLTGKGIKTKMGTGDLFAELVIKIPRSPDEKYVEAAELLKDHSFNPRQA